MKLTGLQALLDGASRGTVHVGPDWWSWSAAQGGLVVALATAAAQAAAPGHPVRSVSARLRGPARGALRVEPEVQRGVAVKHVTVSVWGARLAAEAVCVMGRDRDGPTTAPAAPVVLDPDRYDLLGVYPEEIPFTRHFEVRPVRSRPFGGAHEPELTAWVRLTDDDEPPDARRLAVFLDVMPPSLFATLSEPVPIPTIELSFHVGPALASGTEIGSPWVLVEASTRWAAAGWVSEEVRAWSRGGALLGVAQQLRLVVR